MNDPFLDGRRMAAMIQQLEPEERDRISRENVARSEQEHAAFSNAFKRGECYLCDKSITSLSTKTPCLHWYLRPKGMKKKHISDVAELYGFHETQTYLRWVANEESFARNINDLAAESSGKKLIELTIRYKNLVWSFSCAPTDYEGHASSQFAKMPHYHLSMTVDGRPFISFNDLHLPLNDTDIRSMEAMRIVPNIFRSSFPKGEGMREILTDENLDNILEVAGTPVDDAKGMFNIQTLMVADEGKQISGEDINDAIQRAKIQGTTIAHQLRSVPHAKVRTLIEPGHGVVEQAHRQGRKRTQNNDDGPDFPFNDDMELSTDMP